MSTAYSFVSFLRQGIADAITDIKDLSDNTAASQIKARASVKVTIKKDEATTYVQDHTIELYGPGDIVGIDPRVIIRTEPNNYITNFEPNYLAAIEFYEEDFPWRFTPTAINAAGQRLTPWITLVVLREDEREEVNTGNPLPYFKLKENIDGKKIFCGVENLNFWAHVHVNEDLPNGRTVKDNLQGVLNKDLDCCYSRIICPRRLEANVSYFAYLIPVFESGRKAGRGENVESIAVNQTGWGEAEEDYEKEFPFYYKWYFRTGNLGDFEYLVSQIKPKQLSENVGYRELHLDYKINDQEKTLDLQLPGALKVPLDRASKEIREKIEAYENWEGDDQPHEWQKYMAGKINLADDYQKKDDNADPVITMPLYGEWHARVERLLYDEKGTSYPEDQTKNWVHEINLDPRYRAIAGLGAKVVQQNQEELMAAAWEQIGKVNEANRKIRQVQLAIELNKTYHKRVIERFTEEQLLTFAIPVHKKTLVEPGATVFKAITQSPVPNALQTNIFRKFTRSKIRFSEEFKKNNFFAGIIIKELNDKRVEEIVPAGIVTKDHGVNVIKELVSKQDSFATLNESERKIRMERLETVFRPADKESIEKLELPANIKVEKWQIPTRPFPVLTPPPIGPIPLGTVEGRQPERARAPLLAAANVSSSLAQPLILTDVVFKAALKNTLEVQNLVVAAENKVRIDVSTSSLAVKKQLSATALLKKQLSRKYAGIIKGDIEDEPITPVMAYPTFLQAMYKPLVELSSEYFLPNINLVEQNSITVLQPNSKFIEAYMVGLNHEMARELLWREYPTDQRGSYFRVFWDAVSQGNSPEFTVNEIHTWGKQKTLGDNQAKPFDKLVLVIRGDLLKKYSNTLVYGHKAEWGKVNGQPSIEVNRVLKEGVQPQMPVFEAKIEPDIYFLGFDLTEQEVVGAVNPQSIQESPGWFFVLEERPGEVRFGFDKLPEGSKLPEKVEKWNQTFWEHVGTTEGGIVTFLNPIELAKPEVPPVEDDKQAKWPPTDSAQLAYILFQQPVMLAVHASRLIPSN